VNQRGVLTQRITTLTGLLETPGGPLGPNAGPLGDRLRRDWEVERRLLERLLTETDGDDVSTTIGRWRTRTETFIARSAGGTATWTDRQGCVWEAPAVLLLLADTQDRIDRWLRVTGTDNDTPTPAVAPH
jgi:hypothetical protein